MYRKAISFYVIFLFSGALLSGTENKIPFYSRKHKFLVLRGNKQPTKLSEQKEHLLWEIMVVSKAGHCENNGILLISFSFSPLAPLLTVAFLVYSVSSHSRVDGWDEMRRAKPTEFKKCPKGYNPALEEKKTAEVCGNFLSSVGSFSKVRNSEYTEFQLWIEWMNGMLPTRNCFEPSGA